MENPEAGKYQPSEEEIKKAEEMMTKKRNKESMSREEEMEEIKDRIEDLRHKQYTDEEILDSMHVDEGIEKEKIAVAMKELDEEKDKEHEEMVKDIEEGKGMIAENKQLTPQDLEDLDARERLADPDAE